VSAGSCPVAPTLGAAPFPAAADVLPLPEGGGLEVAYEVVGAAARPVVIVLGGISAGRHVMAHAADPTPGWWDAAVAPGCALDPRRFRILSIDWLGGAGASSGPAAFPAGVTTYDQARAVAAVLDALGVHAAAAVVGASYGGMVALALATFTPARVRRAVVLSAADRSHAMATALRSLQRRIVRLGLDAGRARTAVSIARGVALTTYRTAPEFTARFDPAGHAPAAGLAAIEAYLEHAGRVFAERFDAAAYLCLSESLDRHAVDAAQVRVPVTLVAVDSDTLVPCAQLRALHRRLGRRATLVEVRSEFGHDAFLKEHETIDRVLRGCVAGAP
jgi:homoserine O-acetyltransferase/O-succinyltransferase